MASQQTDVKLRLSEELKDIRSKIVEGKLVLFVGEQVSTLVSPDNPRPSLDDWWQVVNHSEVRARCFATYIGYWEARQSNDYRMSS